MTITPVPITGFPGSGFPITGITPFTYRDGLTFLEKQEMMRDWLANTVLPWFTETATGLSDSWATDVTDLVNTVNAALDSQASNVNGDITDLTDYVNAQIQSIITNSVSVQDPVIKGILDNPASQTRVALDGAYGAKSVVDGLVALTTGGGRLSQASIDSINSAIDYIEKNPIAFATQYGIVGDGSDEGAKVNTFIAAAVAAGAEARFPRGAIIGTGVPIVLPSGARVNLNGATIKSLSTNTGVAVSIQNVTGVHLYFGTIDGNKAEYVPATEWRHNINIIKSNAVKISDVVSKNAKGDGFYIGDNLTGLSTNVYLDRVTADSNYRNGMSVSHVSGMRVNDSDFINTIGTAPQAGADIEPNSTTIACENIHFRNCKFVNNVGDGLRISLQASPTARQAGIYLDGCIFTTSFNGLNIRDGYQVQVRGGSASNNLQSGIKLEAGYGTLVRDIKVHGMDILSNGRDGFLAHSTAAFTNVTVSECTIKDNSTSAADAYHGLWLNPLAGSSGAFIANNYFDGTSQHYHLRTSATVASFTSIGNRFTAGGAGGGRISYSDDINSRLAFDDMSGGKGPSGATAARPPAGTVGAGTPFYDTTLGKPIWSTGAAWKDAAGTIV